MRAEQVQELVRACLADPTLAYRQRVQQLALIAENVLEPPPVSDACRSLQDNGVVHDLGEGHAPFRPRYLLPDYARVIRHGSRHLDLPAPADLDDALTVLLAVYGSVPSITGYPVYLGDLDTLLEPFAAALDDDALDARLRRFWRLVDRLLPDAFVHADLGPADTRIGRAVLRVDRDLRQVVPNLTLRVDPAQTPDGLLREAVLTACRDGKPHLVNHPMMVADLGPDYGVVSCYNSLPRGGGAHTLNRLNLKESVRQHDGGVATYLGRTLPRHVAAISDVFRFEPTVEANPEAVVAVIRGAFAEGMRDFTFDVAGNGFVRITGYLVKVSDAAEVDAGHGVRHSSTVLDAEAITNQHLADRVLKAT